MTNQTLPIARRDELVVQQLKDEILIYDLKINKAFCLNQTSAIVWQLCDGNNSVSEISNELSKKLKQSASEDFVWFAIEQLKKQNLLSNSEEIEINYQALTRREVIRRAGLSTMIALPIVASLVAPTAAMAQSGPAATCSSIGDFCACVTFTDRTGGTCDVGADGSSGGCAPGCRCPVVCTESGDGGFLCSGFCAT